MSVDLQRSIINLPRNIHNASVVNQGAGFATDSYLIGSNCLIPDGLLKAKSKYRCRFNVTKTAAGVATPIISIRIGTTGTISDTAQNILTFAAQTPVADEGVFDITVVFRTVGSATSAVTQAFGQLQHRLSITGLSTDVSGVKISTSSGFNSNVAGLIIGISVNGGTSAAWTISLVDAELVNLT